ncbi:MAG: aminotransferase class IV [Rikenellaceae bacterium]
MSAIPDSLRCGVVKCRIVYSDRILAVNFEQYNYRNIRKLALVYDDTIDYGYKFEDRSSFDHLLKQRGDADEILIVRNGVITDTSFTNVVLRHNDGTLVTPESYLLPGTKRQMLLDRGLISQRRIAVEDLSQYNEIYLINAMIDLEDRIVAWLF